MAIFLPMPANELLANDLADLTAGEVGKLDLRHFPDGETYVRILSDTKGRDVFVVCSLAHPDRQFVGLAFVAGALRQLGARQVHLVAPYLGYMRQDRIFHPGEVLTSRLFAELVQQHFDDLITVEPHLHRHATLDEVYDIPSTVVHARSLFADWIVTHVGAPFLVGPDSEAEPWVESIAVTVGAPWTVFKKERRGDRDVRIQPPDLREFRGRTPVIVDDIVSSGVTMRRAIEIVRNRGFDPPYCLAVHAVCTPRAACHMRDNSAGFLTSNTVPNPDAAFDVAPLIAQAITQDAAAQTVLRSRPKARAC